MPTVNISLTREAAEFVEHEVGSGRYASASELVRAGLRLLQRETAVEDEKIELLRRAVRSGLAEAEAGATSSRTVGDIAAAVLGDRDR